jgi:two-component system, chemotaxis family, chemotaxis protein CheY
MGHIAPRSGIRVLVVDDNPKVRLLVRELLRHAGCDANYSAASADEAISLLHDVQVDVVLTDYHMDKKTGADLARSIREFHVEDVSSLPIVMMTGDVKSATVSAARAAGVDAFVVKPFSVQALMERVLGVLNRPRAPSIIKLRSAELASVAI